MMHIQPALCVGLIFTSEYKPLNYKIPQVSKQESEALQKYLRIDFEALQQRKQKVNSIRLAQKAEMGEESVGITANESFKEGFEGEQWRNAEII